MKMKTKNGDDKISALSDELLLHILSFLPITDSVATCFLSRRWRNLWDRLFVSDFDFDDGDRQIDFVEFVNAGVIITRRKEPNNICKFHLLSTSSTVDIQSPLATWISAALGPHLQEISITLSSPCFFPRCIFRCKSLVSLRLECRHMHVEMIANAYQLPSLKKLELKVCSASCLISLLLCCPNLETLKLDFYKGHTPLLHIGMLSSLKSLTLLGLGKEVGSITINTPLLEHLNINLKSTKCGTLSVTSNLHSLVHVHLNIVHPVGDVVKLLNKLYMAQSLSLNVATITNFHEGRGMEFPEFHRLVRLELIVNYLDSSFVMNVLQHCCVLESFQIHCLEHRRKRKRTCWTQPTVAPSCVESHLKTLEFRGYCDFEEERTFLAYFLERGLVLKKMKIFHGFRNLSVDKKHQILKTLCTLPRSSNICQLMFD
ncbi:hypothetical protein HN51_053338 [Arachis hypogaea]|uniref:FBD-associated F-box protein n=1 Tax=Arachis hypogaea TaxID=3818 RepID=A0A444XC03_ARAHY|nr:F-box/FBD/LRR-repeat protein At4g26340-like [Arachis ipaensis]QHN75666.1 FBD-associated F-box protein [Arachis hypogaea]RYQ87235.1 hypothetical protein Ahy_B09g094712 [Arachis hypogaea]